MLLCSVIIIQQGLYYAMLDNYDLTYLSPYTLYLVSGRKQNKLVQVIDFQYITIVKQPSFVLKNQLYLFFHIRYVLIISYN